MAVANEILAALISIQKPTINVLGATTETTVITNGWNMEPANTTHAFEYWKSISEEKPDYRDAYLAAAKAAIAGGNVRTAYLFTKRAYAIDPIYPQTIVLLTILEKQLH
jgi:hypothetical protein